MAAKYVIADLMRSLHSLSFCLSVAFLLTVMMFATTDSYAEPISRGLMATPKSLHPHFFGGSPGAQVIKDIYEGLVSQNRNGQPVPALAKDYQRASDGLSYTFTLRDNLKWADGSPLTAADFVRSFKALAKPESSRAYGWYLKVANILGAEKALAGNPDALEVKAKGNQLIVYLSQPTPYFLELMTFPSFLPVHKDSKADTPWDKLITNGAFQIKEVAEENIRLSLNKNYYRKSDSDIDEVNYLIIPSWQQQVDLFEQKALTATASLPPFDIFELEKKHPESVFENQSLNTLGLLVNPESEKLKNNEFRQALSMAINRNELIVDDFQGSETRPACSFVAPLTHGFSPDPDTCKALLNNPERVKDAQQLLTRSGTNKKATSIHIISPKRLDQKEVLPKVQQQLVKTLGIKVTISTKEWPEFIEELKEKKYDLLWFGWLAGYNDATAFLLPLIDSPIFGYQSEDFRTILKSAASQKNAVERLPYFLQAEKILAKDLPVIPVLHPSSMILVSPDVSGFYTSNPEGWVQSKHLYLLD
ncbi:hypothetical protein EOPP23_15650 [Endozoicomonas sp. OPT23]|uniref:peptide ABC transporter substrate-binding protein n=1 Tax=Endozoicomonas sp. OPT23 TaxID=2072845 RepID=UPI00129BA493|nr:peptide ABC transporter substrate-binding protein [Endozoicomonas sp. OPT23]MRI34423.1 hypothetical protein [Endozoicomonas sp. OPT23]